MAFSIDDFNSHERGYPALLDIAGGLPVGALVFAPKAIAADIWLPGGGRTVVTHATILDSSRQILRPAPAIQTLSRDPKFDRQARLFGDAGQLMSAPGHDDPPFRDHGDPPFRLMATHPTEVATQPVEGVSGTVG